MTDGDKQQASEGFRNGLFARVHDRSSRRAFVNRSISKLVDCCEIGVGHLLLIVEQRPGSHDRCFIVEFVAIK